MKLTIPQRLAAVALLGIFFAQTVTTIPQLSLTADEPTDVGPGYAYLQTGDLRLEKPVAHPPLLFVLTAAPLLLQPIPDVTALPGWADADLSTFARAFVKSLGDGLEPATFAMRLPILLVSLLGAAFVFRWAADWFGLRAGLAALAFFVFDPNIIAHATLATTDLGLAVFGFASAYLLQRLLRRRPGRGSRKLLFAAGLALGLTLSAKSSGAFAPAILVPLFSTVRFFRLSHAMNRRSSLSHALREGIILAGLATLVLWSLHGFEVRPAEGLGSLPLPFATQWETWLGVRSHTREGHTAFLMGQISDRGWRVYYPIAFALKTPLPFLILLIAAIVRFLREGWQGWWNEVLLWFYPVTYALVTLFSTIAIGYRFLLVVLPFTFVFVSRLVLPAPPHPTSRTTHHVSRITHHASRITYYALLCWIIIGTVRLHPHYLTFFNELAGGPEGGHRYLVDSNLDWGQSFKALRTYLDEQGIKQTWLSYYTYTEPALYGIDYRPIAPSPGAPPVLPSRFDPAPGVYSIGATTLQGVMVADPDMYDWFRHREPIGRPGTAVFVYRVDSRDETPAWLAQCTVPIPPLSTAAVVEGFGRNDLRTVYFDCTSAWIYPGGGESPGWYALFQDTAYSDDTFVQARLGESTLSFQQPRSGALPPFVIYEQGSPPPSPQYVSDSSIRAGHLTFLGHTIESPLPAYPGQAVEVATWWRVDDLPERPLSIMMHLKGPEGIPTTVGDGLGVPAENWQVGDVIVQRHTLILPPDAPPGEYVPTTGVYWLDTMERWIVEQDGNAIGDQLKLSPMNVAAE